MAHGGTDPLVVVGDIRRPTQWRPISKRPWQSQQQPGPSSSISPTLFGVVCGISSRVFNVLWRVIVPLPSFFSRPQLFSAASSSDTSVFFFRQTKTDGRTDGIKSLFKYKRQNFTCRLLCPFPPPGSIIAPFFCWLASKILNFYDDDDDGVRRYNI
jgi:hypothetical protein